MTQRKKVLQKIIDTHPEARETKNKYRTLKAMASFMYPQLKEVSELEDIIYDIVNADRDWRKLTEEYDTENKEALSQQWQIDNGYTDYQNIRCK